MTDEIIGYTVEQSVATVSFNRPDKMNALTPDMLELFFEKVARAAADPEVRVIVVTGQGRAFSAGFDLGFMGATTDLEAAPVQGLFGPVTASEAAGAPQWGEDIGPALKPYFEGGWSGLIRSRKPTIAAINGAAFGWGLILALTCDIRFAARSALMNCTFARLGVPAEKAVAWLLARQVGVARAADLLYTARRVDGVEAERLGMVNAVCEDDELMGHAIAYARAIAANSAPRSLAAMKAQIWTAMDEDYAKAFVDSDREQERCMTTEDFQEGVNSFLEKRSPVFRGR